MSDRGQKEDRRQTILIIDDDATSLDMIVGFLEGYDCLVLISRDGKSGLERAAYVRPDLILLDVMMPGIDGFETCRQLKQNDITASIPVLFLTGLHDTDNVVKGFSVGAVDYIYKPFNLDEVWARVSTHLQMQQMQKSLTIQNERYRQEIERRKEAENLQIFTRKRLESLWKITRLADSDYEDICRHVLDEILLLTESKYAFYGFMGEDDETFKLFAWSDKVMADCQVHDQSLDFLIKGAGFWAEPIRQKKPIIINDFQKNHSGKKGLPEGHVSIERLLLVPVMSSGKIISMAAVANKFEEYTEDDQRQLEAFLGGVQIILDRKQAENRLVEANKKLAQLDTMKSMFIATMSHELRTPLNSIIGFSSVILDGLSGEINDTQKDQLHRIHKASQHLLVMVSEILDISKIEAGKLEAHPEAVQLHGLIQRTVNSLEGHFNKKGLAVRVIVPEDLSLFIDPNRLTQCLTNLLSNAAKFTESGTITITVVEGDGVVIISVEDTGIGIAQNDMARLFLPFERIINPLSVTAGGTGLGLYLIKKLVEEILQGEIEVDSEEGKGSTFRMIVPKKYSIKEDGANE